MTSQIDIISERWIAALTTIEGERFDTAQNVIECFARDIGFLQEHLAFVFDHALGVDIKTRMTEKFVIGLYPDLPNHHRPSHLSLCAYALEKMGLSNDVFKNGLHFPLITAAMLAETSHDIAYHDVTHITKVLTQVIRLVSAHNSIFKSSTRVLDYKAVATLLIATCVHDLEHDGKGNTRKGFYQQGFLEDRAFLTAAPFLRNAGLSDDILKSIHVMILCTEVTPIGDATSPVNQMKAAFVKHDSQDKERLNLSDNIASLEDDERLCLMAMMLHEADIATSAGLSYKLTKIETILHQDEVFTAQAYPQDILVFLRDVCRRRFYTDAGQWLYAANMAQIHALAQRDVEEGNEAFDETDVIFDLQNIVQSDPLAQIRIN